MAKDTQTKKHEIEKCVKMMVRHGRYIITIRTDVCITRPICLRDDVYIQE